MTRALSDFAYCADARGRTRKGPGGAKIHTIIPEVGSFD